MGGLPGRAYVAAACFWNALLLKKGVPSPTVELVVSS